VRWIPTFESPKQGWVGRTLAIVGIVGGFLLLIVLGIFAIRSYRRWRAGKIPKPIFAWTFAPIGIAYLALIVVSVKTLSNNELIMVDFREAVDPFNIGESQGAKYDHVAGTYRVRVKNTDFRLNTSVGEFARTAHAVGIRAEVVELAKPGTSVGAMCLGPGAEGEDELVGYWFFVEPGGNFSLERQDSGGRVESLKQGTDARIETVERVSIICAPAGNDVTLVGFANGLKVVVAEDRDGQRRLHIRGYLRVAKQTGGLTEPIGWPRRGPGVPARASSPPTIASESVSKRA